jgi:hypothetical protein
MQMWFKNIFILFFVSILLSDFAFAQQAPAKADSTNLYKNIESFSKRSKFTKFVYRLIFKPVAKISKKKVAKKKVYKKLIQKPYSAFEGKTIRHINIETLDPFGYSIADPLAASQNFLTKTGNALHVKSQPIAIRNLLLIRQNQVFDSLLVKESERLVRSRGYVHDVSFFVIATSKNSDSVDIVIRELDNWSIIPTVGVTISSVTINLTDKNFLGTGHESKNGITWYRTNGDNAYNINYFIPNIRNTYINTTIHYNKDQFRNSTKSFAVDRPFFSPFAKWAAGVNLTQQFRMDSIHAIDSLFVLQSLLQRFKFNVQDYWAGSAIRIFKGNTENKRTTNFVSTVRFLRIRYLEKPIEMFDTQHMFSNEDFYLASIGISTRKYVQDKFIFRFGVTEDVPIGKVYSLTGGYQVKNNSGRFYLGARISLGNYYPWGYLSSNFEYGTFFHASHTEQGVFTAGVNYFTGLFEIGKWKFRQFVKPQVTIGINRFSSDSLTINDGYGLDGFNSSALSGTSRLLFTLQTQSYAPWNFIGFRFAPYLIYSLGTLGNEVTGFKNSKVYSLIGLGVLIKNESLIFNTFQISIAFYPLIPGKGQDVFKMNSFKTTDFGFRDFEIGKPATTIFQ